MWENKNHIAFFMWSNCVVQLNIKHAYVCSGWQQNAVILSETNSALSEGLHVADSLYKLLVAHRHNVHKQVFAASSTRY